jgi:adenylate cyclase
MTLQQSSICKGCWQQMHLPVPLRGVLSVPFRAFGIRPSKMNPNTCTICELMFTTVMRARKVNIDATILFADLRGYTGLSQYLPPDAISGLLDTFYDECANAIWEHDGLLNKTIGDAIMAVFNFPIRSENHANHAVFAAREIQQRWRAEREKLAKTLGVNSSELGVGIGIHSGQLSFGEFGRSHRDLTAIGTVVNTARALRFVGQPRKGVSS